ncbi:MAG: GNAT family N-acetyltransferase [Pseudonocardiales bacterium]|jgi:RimJ/RimL family protein N-acetyltransferase|nr:GNAT family N-acetyltransferase [Pseudonocardiales bacterium]
MTSLRTARLVLEPLRVEHAEEMAALLDDPALHRFTGGIPDTPDALRERYRRQVAGRSPDGRQEWRNWVVRAGADAAGYVQATILRPDGGPVAELAWVIGTAHQGRGYAREAAAAVVAALPAGTMLVAHIHPDNLASAAVARALGLRPSAREVGGETRWTSA